MRRSARGIPRHSIELCHRAASRRPGGSSEQRYLDEIMLHYSTDIVLVSPVAAKILNDPSGVVKGEEKLRAYFRRGLEAYPSLKFELIDVMCGISSICLY